VTELVPVLAVVVPALPLGCAVALQATRTPAATDRLNIVAALATSTAALGLATTALARGGNAPLHGDLYLIDGASGVFLALIAVIGLCSALTSPAFLRGAGRGTGTTPRCTRSGRPCWRSRSPATSRSRGCSSRRPLRRPPC